MAFLHAMCPKNLDNLQETHTHTHAALSTHAPVCFALPQYSKLPGSKKRSVVTLSGVNQASKDLHSKIDRRSLGDLSNRTPER